MDKYRKIQHILGECDADGHACEYDEKLTVPEREARAEAVIEREREAARDELGKEVKLVLGLVPRHKHVPCEWNEAADRLKPAIKLLTQKEKKS